MFNKKKKRQEKIKLEIFVAISLMAFLALGIVNVLVTGSFRPFSSLVKINSEETASNGLVETKTKEIGDPFITRNPDLRDLLTGPIINPDDPWLGDKYAKLHLVFFSDYTCDICSKQEQILKKIYDKYRQSIKIVWKDYPDSKEGSPSFQAALASQCAASQDKFWPYHDFLYQYNKKLNQESFLEIADIVDLKIGDFKKCFEEKATKKKVRDSIEEANILQITGIPFLYVGRQEVMGEMSYEELERLVELELNR